ncbi:MAG: hypothetical protein EXQ55_08210 [Acidobacteria bacterium]|nr:hypothetical protein [Acidobacteriota bacterium]
MAVSDEPEKRPASPVGLIIALAALGLLIVLLLFQSSPDADPPPDQAPVAMALVDNLMTNGVLVDYDCAKTTAWANRAVWSKYNVEQRRNMVISLATVCSVQRGSYRISVLDYDSKRELAAFDGKKLTVDE